MRPRGAIPSPRHRLASARPFEAAVPPPDEFINLPSQVNAWGNTQFGDCVTAEEFASKAVASVQGGWPELYWPEQAAIDWARAHGVLNGAVITDVLDMMVQDGIVGPDGTTYHDGPHLAVDWTNLDTLKAAIYQGPIKIGVDATPYEHAVGGSNGWIILGDVYRSNYDHCVSICGYGQLGTLCQHFGVPVPAGTDPTTVCLVVFTWGTFGVVDHPSLLNNCSEAWLRTPTTPEEAPKPAPTPTPTPTPPAPNPTPTPLPAGTYSITGTVTLTSQG